MNKYPQLKLENQLCFPLYACSKEIVRRYTPFLEEIGLTYTQYITMMVMWEEEEITVKKLGEKLLLDSGTLTPVIKKLETKELIKKSRNKEDERSVIIRITKKGRDLYENAKEIPEKVGGCLSMERKDAEDLYKLLNKLMAVISE
ncbi:MAG: MarR family transcriptional regulator [Clostridiales bacterium]|nr:MarR family transcriptional regulator [Clostridiales bacterium]